MKKIGISLLLLITLLCTSIVFALEDISEIVPYTDPRPVDTGSADRIIGMFQWIAYAISVGMLVFIGIKYIMASADEKADLKKSLIRYVAGAVLIAGAVTIASLIFNMNA